MLGSRTGRYERSPAQGGHAEGGQFLPDRRRRCRGTDYSNGHCSKQRREQAHPSFSHLSHFGSRYKLGCCGHAGLFSSPVQFFSKTFLEQTIYKPQQRHTIQTRQKPYRSIVSLLHVLGHGDDMGCGDTCDIDQCYMLERRESIPQTIGGHTQIQNAER